MNDHLVLISGTSGTGKSFCLNDLKDQEGVLYLNTESNKKLPFKCGFQQVNITDPLQIPQAFTAAEEEYVPGGFFTAPVHTIVVDTLDFAFDQFESLYIIGQKDGREGWQAFAQWFKTLMQNQVANSTKNVVFLAHTLTVLNEEAQVMETKVPVKGALKNQGIESYFSIVLSTKRFPLKKLSAYESDMLNITQLDEDRGVKHCFQTDVDKDTVNEKMRGPVGLFSREELFIDNNLQQVLDRLHAYYD